MAMSFNHHYLSKKSNIQLILLDIESIEKQRDENLQAIWQDQSQEY